MAVSVRKRLLLWAMFVVFAAALGVCGQQGKDTVAVYMSGAEPKGAPGSHMILRGELEKALTRVKIPNTIESKYAVVTLKAGDLSAVANVHKYIQSGAVNVTQREALALLGKQLGVTRLCVVEIGEAGRSYYVTAKLVNMVTAEIGEPASGGSQLKDYNEMMALAKELALEMTGVDLAAGRSGGSVQQGRQGGGGNYSDNLAGEMVYVQGGTFRMGCTAEQSECDNDERPVRSVTVSDFYIGKYEVTQGQWRAVMGNNPSGFSGDAKLPVEKVSWDDVQTFIERLNSMTGKRYRLPTEAEWEFAARGGVKSNGYKYSGSNSIDYVAWYSGNSGSKTHIVGNKLPNELGIYDMSGNVWEWVNDWYGNYLSDAQTNPRGPAGGSFRVFRGGSWYYVARYCRVSFRNYITPGYRYGSLGFRLAVSPQ